MRSPTFLRMSLTLALLAPAPLAAQSRKASLPDESFFKGDPKAVMLACAERALRLKPGTSRVQAQVGRVQLVAGEVTSAEATFKSIGSVDGETLRWMGQGWIEAGQTPRAMDPLARLQTMVHGYPDEVAIGAILLMDAGRPKEASELMDSLPAAKLWDWEDVICGFGRACLRQRRQDLAATWYARSMVDNRRTGALWAEIALSLQSQGGDR